MTDENDNCVGIIRRLMKVIVMHVSFLIACCSLVASVVVTRAVNLDAVLAPALVKCSAGVCTWRMVAENERGAFILHFLPVDKRGTVVHQLSCWHVGWILRESNFHVVPLEREVEKFTTSTLAPFEGNLGLEIDCLAHFHVMIAEASTPLHLLLRAGPEVVLDNLLAVEGVDFWADGVHGVLLVVHAALKALQLIQAWSGVHFAPQEFKLLHYRAKKVHLRGIGVLLLGLKVLNILFEVIPEISRHSHGWNARSNDCWFRHLELLVDCCFTFYCL